MSQLSEDDKLDHALAALAAASPILPNARHATIVGRILATPDVDAGDADLVGVIATHAEPPRSRARMLAAIGIGLAAAASLAIWVTRSQSEEDDRRGGDVDQPGMSVMDAGVPSTPTAISPNQLEADRLTGDKNILPDAETIQKIAADKKRVIASIKLCLDLQGHVTSSTLLKSSGYPAYDRELLDGVKLWTYKPQRLLLCTAVTFIFSAHD